MTTRFAPSPTGFLHIGGLRTALYSYLWAKKKGGNFLLRIEDTDLKRNSKEATEAILEAFSWCGLSHDEEIFYQSKRFDIYAQYIQQLLAQDKAYKCYMSKEELEELRQRQQANKERPRYDGRYRDFKGSVPQGIEPVIRIKAPTHGTIKFHDGVKGEMSFNVEDMLDDFIIARSDGTPTYNFVVAIDDALMGVTDVIRGDDHLSNTPKQIVIYNALEFNLPTFYHVPMIHNMEGKKLSKRDGATDVMEYKKLGFLPEALLNFLIRLGWSHGDQEIFSIDEMIEFFDPNRVNASASAYNYEKLLWLNSQYINHASHDKLINELKNFDVAIENLPMKHKIIDLVKDRAKTLIELANEIELVLKTPLSYDEKSIKKSIKNLEFLEEFFTSFQEQKELHTKDEFETFAHEFLHVKELGLGKLAQPLRVALVGSLAGAGIFDIMEIIGFEESKKRVINYIKFCKGRESE